MVTASIKDDLRSFRRSWVHHTGMQLATLTVLAATLTVVGFVLSLSLNLSNLLASWGDNVQITVYLLEDVTEGDVARIRETLTRIREVAKVTYVPREVATNNFKMQMASYAPDLLDETDFESPFPASFRLALRAGVREDNDIRRLKEIADAIGNISGVEDVSYGQGWLQNYSSFVSALSTGGGVVISILLLGSLFVVGNSIRVSIAARREEIEILELVGATSSMIRKPYVMEGFMMGVISAMIALSINFGLFLWQKSLMASNLAFARLAGEFGYFDLGMLLGFLSAAGALGAIGAWLTVRTINDGWSARQRTEN